MSIIRSRNPDVTENYMLFGVISKRKIIPEFYCLPQVHKGYIVRKANEQTIKENNSQFI